MLHFLRIPLLVYCVGCLSQLWWLNTSHRYYLMVSVGRESMHGFAWLSDKGVSYLVAAVKVWAGPAASLRELRRAKGPQGAHVVLATVLCSMWD